MSDGMSNPYLVDLPFEADLCLRQIQQHVLRAEQSFKTPLEIFIDALFSYAELWGIRHDRDNPHDGGGSDDDDDHRSPDPPSPPLPRPDDGAALDLELRELIAAPAILTSRSR
jgi:hypothetical protein